MQTDFEEESQPVDCPMEEIASDCEEDDPLWDPADESASALNAINIIRT